MSEPTKATDHNEEATGVTIGDIDGGIHDSAIAGRDVIFQIGPLKLSRRVAFLLVTMLLIAVAAVIVNAVNLNEIRTAATAPIPTLTITPSATQVPTSTPTPLPFLPARAGETLIVIAKFHSTVDNTEPHIKIRRMIEEKAAAVNIPSFRVETEPLILMADDQNAAEKLGNQYHATMVIWGEDTGVAIDVNFLYLKELGFPASKVTIQAEEGQLQIVNPSGYARFITKDLPGQLTFLSLLAIGRSYTLAGEYTKALTTVQQAIDSLSPDTRSVEGLANAYFGLGWLSQMPEESRNLLRAIDAYSKAIKWDANYALAYNNRGIVYRDQGEFKRAIDDFSEAIALDHDPLALPYNNRGLVYEKQEKYDLAIDDYTEAIKLDANYALAYNNRGIVYGKRGEYALAIADFGKAIELDHDPLSWPYNNRALVYKKQEKYDLAIADYNEAIKLGPNYAPPYNNRGTVYGKQGEYALAVDDYTTAIKLDPKYAYAYRNRGVVYSDQGRYEEAITDFSQAIALEPHHALAYYDRGNVYYTQKLYAKAIADYQQALEIDQDLPDSTPHKLAEADRQAAEQRLWELIGRRLLDNINEMLRSRK